VETSEIVGHYSPMASMVVTSRPEAEAEAARKVASDTYAKDYAAMMADLNWGSGPRYEMHDVEVKSGAAATSSVVVPEGFRFRLVSRSGERRAVQGMMF
jgi:hypothetical protein